ncbi:MAG: histidine kinase, partial [Lutibacter sp.]
YPVYYSCQVIEKKDNTKYLMGYLPQKNNLLIFQKKIDSTYIKNPWVPFKYSNLTNNSIKSINNNSGFILKNFDKEIKFLSSKIRLYKNNFLAKIYKTKNYTYITNLNQGAYYFNSKNNKLQRILKNVRTTRLYNDSEGNIWIGSISNGLFFIPNINAIGKKFLNNKRNKLHPVTFFNNHLFIGNELGEIIKLNPQTLQVENIQSVANTIQRIRKLKSYEKQLFVLSDFNIKKIFNNTLGNIKNIHDNTFYKLRLVNFKDFSFNDKYLFTANANGVGQINLKTNKVKKIWNQRSTSILYLKDSLFIGTTNGLYLKHIRNNSDTIEPFKINENFDVSIIYDLVKSHFGVLVGSNSQGLAILNKKKNLIINTSNGLLSNYIRSIFVDDKNNIWLSTNFGLNKLSLNNDLTIKTIKSYTISDGLYSNDVRSCTVNNNKVYVATSNGLNVINLNDENNSLSHPKIHLNYIAVNNKNIPINKPQKFNYNQNNIEFNYSGISFKNLGTIKFKYQLVGLEDNWITTQNNTIRYAALNPGTYTFSVKAIAKDKVESKKIASYTFEILPVFYNTWWFKLSSVLLLLILAFIVYKNKVKKLEKERIVNDKITSLKYQALNAQMNPHFINNLLVNIQYFAKNNNINEVEKSLKLFGNLVNLTLNATKSNLISLAQELEMTKLYLELQQIRFHKNFEFSINTNSISNNDLNFILIPPVIIQPLVENSIKHGFSNRNANNKININCYTKNNQFLICEISDNGIGLNRNAKTKGNGISVHNIKERLQFISAEVNSSEKFVEISNIKNEFNTLVGAKVTLKIPLITL